MYILVSNQLCAMSMYYARPVALHGYDAMRCDEMRELVLVSLEIVFNKLGFN